MKFIKKLFGSKNKTIEKSISDSQNPETKPTSTERQDSSNKFISKDESLPEIISRHRDLNKGKSLEELNDLYFYLLEQIQIAEKKGDIRQTMMHCLGSLGLIEPLIKYTKNELGSFYINKIPAIEKSLIYSAIYGNIGQIKNIEDIVNYFKDLHHYKELVTIAYIRKDLASKIYQYVKANPNCQQSELKKGIDFKDGRLISTTVHYMEKAGKLSKTKEGKKIFLKIK
jgi:hypothetical protein